MIGSSTIISIYIVIISSTVIIVNDCYYSGYYYHTAVSVAVLFCCYGTFDWRLRFVARTEVS